MIPVLSFSQVNVLDIKNIVGCYPFFAGIFQAVEKVQTMKVMRHLQEEEGNNTLKQGSSTCTFCIIMLLPIRHAL